MTKRTAVALVAITMGFGAADGVAGQERTPAPSPLRVGLSLALGPASEGLGGETSLSVGGERSEVILRASGTSELAILTAPEVSVSDVALLYGRRRAYSKGWLGGALGLGLVDVTRRGAVKECVLFFCSHEQDRTRTAGLAFRAEGVFTPLRFLGVGVRMHGNANPERSFVGIGVGLYLGGLR